MIRVLKFACFCGAQSEYLSGPVKCWSCGAPMHQWGSRMAECAPREIGKPA